MRPSAASADRSAVEARQAFADAVQFYLTLSPRQLPSEFLYDALGSALFDAICELPWYRITRAERALLDRHGAEILSRVEPLSRVVELGPGSGAKIVALLGSRATADDLTVHLVDISAAALTLASRALAELGVGRTVSHQTTYDASLVDAVDWEAPRARTLMLFLGSNIGNFDPPGANAFLRHMRAALSPGDALLLGADLVKPEAELLLAYDDPLGITAAFNRNLLVRINRELGGDFAIERFVHRALWNGARSRVEMHLVATARQRVSVPAASIDATFEPGETIWTESSYKYEPDEIASMLEQAGFRHVEQWIDADARFALTLVDAI